nr:MAG TPA: hypothetical protein [Caudoviricetes sp.]
MELGCTFGRSDKKLSSESFRNICYLKETERRP